MKDLCMICNKYPVDGVPTGSWAYDLTCGICIEDQLKKEGIKELNAINEVYKDRALLELAALGAMASALTKRRKDKK